MGDQGKPGHKPTKPLFDSNSESKNTKKCYSAESTKWTTATQS